MFTHDSVEHLVRALRSCAARQELNRFLEQFGDDEESEAAKYEALNSACHYHAAIWHEYCQIPHLVRWLIRARLGIANPDDAIMVLSVYIDEAELKKLDPDLLLASLETFCDVVTGEDLKDHNNDPQTHNHLTMVRVVRVMRQRLELGCATKAALQGHHGTGPSPVKWRLVGR